MRCPRCGKVIKTVRDLEEHVQHLDPMAYREAKKRHLEGKP